MNKRLKQLVAAAVVLILAVLALAGWYFTRHPADSGTLVLFGNVDIRQVSLAFNGSERIAEMRVQEGDRVEAGQVIARLDTRALTLQIAEAEARIAVQEQVLLRLKNGTRPEEVAQTRAEVRAAQAEADLAEVNLTRLRDITDNTSGAVSEQDLDSARARRRVARAQLENRKKALQLARIGPRREDIAQAGAQLNGARAELALLNSSSQPGGIESPHQRHDPLAPAGTGRYGLTGTPGLCAGNHRPEMGARLHNRSRSGPYQAGNERSA